MKNSLLTKEDINYLNKKDIKNVFFFDIVYLEELNCYRILFEYEYKREKMKASTDLFFRGNKLDEISFSPVEERDSLFLYRKIGKPLEDKKKEIEHEVRELLKKRH